MNKEQKNMKNTIRETYIELGKFLEVLPKIWKMKVATFNDRLGDDLGYDPETIRGFTTKTMTKEISYTKLFPALRRVMLSSVEDKESDPERAKELACKYAKSAAPVLCMMALQYASIEFLTPAVGFLTDENEMTRTLGQFMNGSWPKDSAGLNKEEADYLRECLNHYPPKCIKPKKIISTGKNMKDQFGEILGSQESAEEILDKRAKEMLKAFYITDDT